MRFFPHTIKSSLCVIALCASTAVSASDAPQSYHNFIQTQREMFDHPNPKYADSDTIDWNRIETNLTCTLSSDARDFLKTVSGIDWEGDFETFSPLTMHGNNTTYIPLVRNISNSVVDIPDLPENIRLLPFAKQDAYYWVMHINAKTQDYTIRCVLEAVPGFQSEYEENDTPLTGKQWIKQRIDEIKANDTDNTETTEEYIPSQEHQESSTDF